MTHSIHVLFYIRTSEKAVSEPASIYLRISVNSKRIEKTINRYVDRLMWAPDIGRMKGNRIEAKDLNNFLDVLTNRVYAAERQMMLDGKEVTYETFKDKWLGRDVKKYMLLEVFKQHNEEVALLIGKDFTIATLQRYKTSLDHTRNFIEWKYKCSDIDITKLNYEFISSYALWLKTVRDCNHNSTMKYLANFKKIVLICLKNGWIIKDPFLGFKITKLDVERPILTELELQQILSKKFPTERLDLVRDIFIFSCYTGLAYADVKKLKRSEIIIGVDGEKWISTKRQKTDTVSKIPLLPVALALIDQYKNNLQCTVKDRVLPVLSNQKMNAYLKEIVDICGIN